MEKKRSKLLATLQILASIGIVFGGINLLIQFINPSPSTILYLSLPSWYPIFQIVGLLVGAIILTGIWLWKRWAVYLGIISTIISIPVVLFLSPTGINIVAMVVNLIVIGVWFLAIYQDWQYFD